MEQGCGDAHDGLAGGNFHLVQVGRFVDDIALHDEVAALPIPVQPRGTSLTCGTTDELYPRDQTSRLNVTPGGNVVLNA